DADARCSATGDHGGHRQSIEACGGYSRYRLARPHRPGETISV
ncbi:MAG: hypothetical protein AVDCRST_MAG45-1984, partial [uncultured Solirubrobacterales bacterium]